MTEQRIKASPRRRVGGVGGLGTDGCGTGTVVEPSGAVLPPPSHHDDGEPHAKRARTDDETPAAVAPWNPHTMHLYRMLMRERAAMHRAHEAVKLSTAAVSKLRSENDALREEIHELRDQIMQVAVPAARLVADIAPTVSDAVPKRVGARDVREYLAPVAPDARRSATCTICLSDLGRQAAGALSCGHVFHKTCARDWLTRHNTCPNCRSPAVHRALALRVALHVATSNPEVVATLTGFSEQWQLEAAMAVSKCARVQDESEADDDTVPIAPQTPASPVDVELRSP